MKRESKSSLKQWFVYILEADDGSWYTGITTDVGRRFSEHSSGLKGARYFRGRKPRTIVFQEEAPDRSGALQREAQIKKMSRAQKERMVESVG